VTDSTVNQVFAWFQNLTTIAQLFTWSSICIAYIQFRKALIAQGVDRKTLVFKSPFQPYTAWAALFYFGLIIIFNGFKVFTKGNWDVGKFFTAYVGILIYFLLFTFWKVFKRTKPVKPVEADIWTGKEALDAEVWPEQIPRNIIEKFWYWLC
jgi:yeast amino acid transporter